MRLETPLSSNDHASDGGHTRTLLPKRRPERYSIPAVLLHWSIAFAVLALLASGFAAASEVDAAAKATILRFHLPVGVLVLALTLLRLTLAVRDGRASNKPGPVPGGPRWQSLVARATHILLYAIPIGMAASGIGLVALSGAGPPIFAGGTLPNFGDFGPRIPHGIGARLMVLLVTLHVAAALYHQFVRGDGLLRRMWPATVRPPHQP